MIRPGSWWLHSDINPRWNTNGRSDCTGGFEMPPECKTKFEKLKKVLGKPPKDLEFGYMKD
jgi:hypothetical protein